MLYKLLNDREGIAQINLIFRSLNFYDGNFKQIESNTGVKFKNIKRVLKT